MSAIFRVRGLACVLAGALFALPAVSQTFYALEYAGPAFVIINPMTGADISSVGSTGLSSTRGMAMDPTTGMMYAIDLVGGTDATLYTINITNGMASLVAATGQPFRDLTFDNTGQLWGIIGGTGAIHPIDKGTGAVGMLLTTAAGPNRTTLAFRPADGLLYAYTFGGGNYSFESVDPTDGTTVAIALSGTEPTDNPRGLTFDPTSGLFRLFDNSGNYWTLTEAGVQSDTGSDNATIYMGLAFDQTTTVPVELQSFSVE